MVSTLDVLNVTHKALEFDCAGFDTLEENEGPHSCRKTRYWYEDGSAIDVIIEEHLPPGDE